MWNYAKPVSMTIIGQSMRSRAASDGAVCIASTLKEVRDMLEKWSKKATAILAIVTLVTLLGSAIVFAHSIAALPTAITEIEQRITDNDEVTLAVARYVIGRAHREYTEQGYVYRFALEYILDIYNAAQSIRSDPMMIVMVEEIKALPIEIGR